MALLVPDFFKGYFDLNERSRVGAQEEMRARSPAAARLPRFVSREPYPPSTSVPSKPEVERKESWETQIEAEIVEEKRKETSVWEQIILYLGTVAGVFFSSLLMQFKAGEPVKIQFSWILLLVSALVALIIIPIAFEKLRVKTDAPFIARLGLFVQHGVFWQVLLGAVGAAVAA